MKKGFVSIILHSHLPFVRHPDLNEALEERWLFEAIQESYLPLLEVFNKLKNEKVSYKITMSISPTLISMLGDPYLNQKFLSYMENLILLSSTEIERTKNEREFNRLAAYYSNRFNDQLKIYKQFDCNLLNAFKELNSSGHLDLITTSATHSILPLMLHHPEAIKAQLITGMKVFENAFGYVPDGIWLPECAYYYNLDSILKELGIKYFISENKTVLNAVPKPCYGSFTPIAIPSGIAVFPRDAEASCQVWSNVSGYPGDSKYREFYRDIGHDLPLDYISPFINATGVRHDTGIKYYSISDKSDEKNIYNREEALKIALAHGKHYALARYEQINSIVEYMDTPPIIVCPFDTELFGHWWYEGPEFLEAFIREAATHQSTYSLITPSDYLKELNVMQCASPASGSWGANGDFSIWLNRENDWIAKELYYCRETLVCLASKYKDIDSIDSYTNRSLNQAARELMLAESSDWAFIISKGTSTAYAINRICGHLNNFKRLCEDMKEHKTDEAFLVHLEKIDNIFPNLDYRFYTRHL
jgi:1,4-alpha-glucan branching enzyme